MSYSKSTWSATYSAIVPSIELEQGAIQRLLFNHPSHNKNTSMMMMTSEHDDNSNSFESVILFGDRVKLPQSAMEQLSQMGQLGSTNSPLMLTVKSATVPTTASTEKLPSITSQLRKRQQQRLRLGNGENGTSDDDDDKLDQEQELKNTIACGVLDFSSAENTAIIPTWMAKSLGVKNGEKIIFQRSTFAKAESCVIQPLDQAFYSLKDQRGALETALMSQFTTLTKGEKVRLYYEGKIHILQVVDLTPESRGCIVDTNLSVNILPSPSASSLDSNDQPSEVLELVLGSEVEVLATNADFTYLKFQMEQLNRSYKITCIALTSAKANELISDFEAVVGDCLRGKPTREAHLRLPQRDSIGEAIFDLVASECHDFNPLSVKVKSSEAVHLEAGQYYLGLKALDSPSCKIKISFSIEDDDSSNKIALEPSLLNSKLCDTCKKMIAMEQYDRHTAFCWRNNVSCEKCHKVMLKANAHHHSHCALCDSPTDGERELKKHHLLRHTPHACDQCQGAVSLPEAQLVWHRFMECEQRVIVCRYCQCKVVAGPAPTNLADRVKGLTSHESYCGSKTQRCPSCSKNIVLRDWKLHQQIHEFDSAKAAAADTQHAMPKAGTASSRRGNGITISTGVGQQEPLQFNSAQLDQLRERTWNKAFGLDSMDVDVKEDHESLMSLAGVTFPQDSGFRYGEESSERAFKKPTLCANEFCCAILPEPPIVSMYNLCLACWKKISGLNADAGKSPKAALTALTQLYFAQLRTGCCKEDEKDSKYHNTSYCQFGNEQLRKEPVSGSALLALKLAQESSQVPSISLDGMKSNIRFHLCVDASMKEKYDQAAILVNLSGAPLEWAVYAQQKFGRSVDRAADWILANLQNLK